MRAAFPSGKFAPTEAAVVAVVYSLIVGFFAYRELTMKKLLNCMIKAAISSGMVLILAATASLFSWIMTGAGVGNMLKELVR